MNWKWHIFNADLNPSLGSEQQGVRPVLVISDEQYLSAIDGLKARGLDFVPMSRFCGGDDSHEAIIQAIAGPSGAR